MDPLRLRNNFQKCLKNPKFDKLKGRNPRCRFDMIKPILYHSFEEKAKLEAELFGKLTPAKRRRVAKAWMTIASDTRLVREAKKRISTSKARK